jgi:hypothetical protein
MLLVDSQADMPSSRPSAGGDRIRLHLRADGQLLELPHGKTTIGSSPKCNVRLERPGIQPLHCLIVHTSEDLRVRSWASNTKLNGESFVESALAPGDCLSVGSVDLEVVGRQSDASRLESADAAPANHEDTGRVRAGLELARSRGHRLLAELRRERKVGQDLQAQIGDLQEAVLQAIDDGNDASRKLKSTLAELAEARQQFAALERARDEQINRNEEFSQKNEMLTRQNNVLTGQNEALSRQNSVLTEQNEKLSGQTEFLISQNEELTGRAEGLARENQNLDLEVHDLSSRLNRLTDEQTVLSGEHQKLLENYATLQAENHELLENGTRLKGEFEQLSNEKLMLNEQHRQLADDHERLKNEFAALTGQKSEADQELAILREENEQLAAETRAQAAELQSLADERLALCQEQDELKQHHGELQSRLAQLNEENSAFAVARLTLSEQCDALGRQNQQNEVQIAQLRDEYAALRATEGALRDEYAQLQSENVRLTNLEREMQAALSSRESASEELYRALLQLAELQERDSQNLAVLEAHQLACKERDQLAGELEQLKDTMRRQSEERAAVESAWQALREEAAILSESRQQLADDNSKLLADLQQMQQQLEMAQHQRIALDELTRELERERAGRKESEASASAAIAEIERRQAEQARTFTESIQKLQQKLGAAGDVQQSLEQARHEWNQARDEWNQQVIAANSKNAELAQRNLELEQARDEWNHQLIAANSKNAELAQRNLELETKLVAAEDVAARLNRQTSCPRETAIDNAAIAPVSRQSNDQSAGFDWSTIRQNSTPCEVPGTGDDDNSFAAPDKVTSDQDWASSSGTGNEWSSTRESAPVSGKTDGWGQSDRSDDPASDTWSSSEAIAGTDDDAGWGRELGTDATATDDPFSNSAGEQSSQAEPDVWSSSAPESSTSASDRNVGLAGAINQPVANRDGDIDSSIRQSTADMASLESKRTPVANEPVKKVQSTSFIERYSHMFTDEAAANDTPTSSNVQPANVGNTAPAALNQKPKVEPLTAKSDEEESIEDYMAKLLQRVRGESSSAANTFVPPASAPLNTPTSVSQSISLLQTSPPVLASPVGEATDVSIKPEIEQPIRREAPVRKAAAPAAATDLGALRALANETARRAISRHELRKHRRNAVTKVIVSTLAGVTSLWLMLDSPDWKTMQFVTACVSLIVAAIWAGETYRTMLESFRAAAYDASEAGLDETDPVQTAGLPIDIDERLQRSESQNL